MLWPSFWLPLPRRTWNQICITMCNVLLFYVQFLFKKILLAQGSQGFDAVYQSKRQYGTDDFFSSSNPPGVPSLTPWIQVTGTLLVLLICTVLLRCPTGTIWIIWSANLEEKMCAMWKCCDRLPAIVLCREYPMPVTPDLHTHQCAQDECWWFTCVGIWVYSWQHHTTLVELDVCSYCCHDF